MTKNLIMYMYASNRFNRLTNFFVMSVWALQLWLYQSQTLYWNLLRNKTKCDYSTKILSRQKNHTWLFISSIRYPKRAKNIWINHKLYPTRTLKTECTARDCKYSDNSWDVKIFFQINKNFDFLIRYVKIKMEQERILKNS